MQRLAGITFVSAASILCMWSLVQGLTLSQAQVADRDVGRSDGFVGYGLFQSLKPGMTLPTEAAILDAAHFGGATKAFVMLSSAGVQLSSAQRIGVTATVTMWEGPWTTLPFPKRFRLQSGRWPERPGEVVLVDGTDLPFAPGSSRILGDVSAMKIVGRADDRFNRAPSLLASPGTWALLPARRLSGYPALSTQPVLFWEGGAAESIVRRVSEVAVASSLRSEFEDSVFTRASLLHRRPRSSAAQAPAGYLIPAILMPPLTILFVVGLLRRRATKTIERLVSVGASRPVATWGLAIGAGGWFILGSLLGGLFGYIIGVASSTPVATHRGRPQGPIGTPWSALALHELLVVLSLAAAGIVWSRREWFGSTPKSRRSAVHVRRVTGILTIFAAVLLVARLKSPVDGMVLTAVVLVAAVILVPDIVDWTLGHFVRWNQGPRSRLASRRMLAERSRVVALCQVAVVVLGSAVSYLMLLDSLIQTAGSRTSSAVSPGQVLTQDPGFALKPAPLAVQRLVSQHPLARNATRIELKSIAEVDGERIDMSVTSVDGQMVLAADDERDVAAILGMVNLTEMQTRVFRSGGLIVRDDASVVGADGQIQLVVQRNGRHTDVSLSSTRATFPRVDWLLGRIGILRSATVRQHGWPLTSIGTLFVGVGSDGPAKIRGAVIAAGLDPSAVMIYRRPPDPIPPTILTITGFGLALISILAIWAAAVAQGRALQGYVGRLMSLGLRPRWCRQVLLLQMLSAVGIAVVIVASTSVVPAAAVASRLDGFKLSVPWLQIILVVGLFVLVATIVTIASARTIRPNDWRSDV